MENSRRFFAALKDLIEASNWFLQAVGWMLGTSGCAVSLQMLATYLGAPPLQALSIGIAGALVLAVVLVLYRLYQMNKPLASIKCAEVICEQKYPNVQIGFLEFSGIGASTRMEVYCTHVEALGATRHALQILAMSPGRPFTLSRTEKQLVELIRYDRTRPTPTITITLPTKYPVEEWLAGEKFRLVVTAYAGLVREEITVDCWLDQKGDRLYIEEVPV